VKAELLVPSTNLVEAEEALHRDLTVAREQAARLFELRIAITLARIWRNQGHSSKARDLLAANLDQLTLSANCRREQMQQAACTEVGFTRSPHRRGQATWEG
jgi:hypothetical protein